MGKKGRHALGGHLIAQDRPVPLIIGDDVDVEPVALVARTPVGDGVELGETLWIM